MCAIDSEEDVDATVSDVTLHSTELRAVGEGGLGAATAGGAGRAAPGATAGVAGAARPMSVLLPSSSAPVVSRQGQRQRQRQQQPRARSPTALSVPSPASLAHIPPRQVARPGQGPGHGSFFYAPPDITVFTPAHVAAPRRRREVRGKPEL
jgi:hypothetical protein